ncbi:nacht domain protein [Ilyonectria robusta]
MLPAPPTTQRARSPSPTALATRESAGSTRPTSFSALSITSPAYVTGHAYADWYLETPRNRGVRWTDPAKRAFDSAIEVLQNVPGLDDSYLVWIRDKTSMANVQDALEKAVKEYENKAEDSKVRQWLARCSSRVLYYATIFDVYAPHHRDYVSFAWGAFKFLFIAVMNQEELLVELAKAISRIADVLPRTELHAGLYRTDRIQQAVSMVYAKIIEFSIRAIKWYKKNKLKHSITSIIKPFSLSFKDIVDEISDRSRTVDELASAAAKAEIRDLHINVRHLTQGFNELKEIMIASQIQQSQIMIDLRDQRQFFCNNQIQDMKNLLMDGTTPPKEDLTYCSSMRNRRRQRTPVQLPPPEILKLKAWLSNPSSSLLLAREQGIRTSALDFATGFLEAVLEGNYSAIWVLPSAGGDCEPPPSVIGVLKSLVLQALTINPNGMSEGAHPVRMQHLGSAVTIEQWFKVLERCLRDIPRLLIVIDMRIIEMAVDHDEDEHDCFRVSDFVQMLHEIVQNRARGGLKIVIVSWRFKTATLAEAEEIFGDEQIFTDGGRRMEKMMRQPRYRAVLKRDHVKFTQRLKVIIQELGNED